MFHLHQENLKKLGKEADHEIPITFVFHKPLSQTELEKVKSWLHEQKLEVIQLNPRHAKVKGHTKIISKVIGKTLYSYHDEKKKLQHGFIDEKNDHVPQKMKPFIGTILGLSSHAHFKPHFHLNEKKHKKKHKKQPFSGYSGNQVGALYNFPQDNHGEGQSIAIIELGGGYNDQDLDDYFTKIGVSRPNVVSVSVDGATNSPTNPQSADGEVCLDIEVAGSIASAANIVVYFAPNTDLGFYHSIDSVINDTKYAPKIISISWGSAESNWDPSGLNALNSILQQASESGISIFCSAGDNGSSDGVQGSANVDFPGSSDFVTSCGGTYIQLSDDQKSIVSETVWNDDSQQSATGGGVSSIFSVPSYQSNFLDPLPVNVNSGKTGRSVPDIAGNADPNSGYLVLCDGQYTIVGGTSAVSPLMAAFQAIMNSKTGKTDGYGLMNNLYYTTKSAQTFNDITVGNNGQYQAQEGYDCCSGLGSLNGSQFLQSLINQNEYSDKKRNK